ncbi:DUF202 domain-containing protein [Patescibacteria group bacterium]|nr:DUF202 domain-containing protein [Patescibacteria group bacterium]
MKELHKHYNEGRLTLRDYLAAHRTVLANDRTWLGNIRTSMTFFVAGVSFIQFFDLEIIRMIGWAFIPIGILNLILGLFRYIQRRKMISGIKIKKKIREILQDDGDE